jgi:YHS domain-containing protein
MGNKRPERCSNTLTRKGKKHHFCTKRCKERFEKEPGKFQ